MSFSVGIEVLLRLFFVTVLILAIVIYVVHCARHRCAIVVAHLMILLLQTICSCCCYLERTQL